MKTPFNGRKCIAVLLGPISALVLFGTLNSSFAFAEPYAPQTSDEVGAYGTGAEVPVPPWCAWHSSIPEDILLDSVDDPLGIIVYRGDAVDLAFVSGSNYTYVGGGDNLTTKARASNCSWFGEPAHGSRLDVEINRTLFWNLIGTRFPVSKRCTRFNWLYIFQAMSRWIHSKQCGICSMS